MHSRCTRKRIEDRLTPRQAIQLQQEWAEQVRLVPLEGGVKLIAAADAAFPRHRESCIAGVVVMTFPELEPVEEQRVEMPVVFPYIPGLLSFRECPPIIKALDKLTSRPDVILLDGQGYAHPRRLGLASHLGLLVNRPTIGAAKSRLIGEHLDVGPRKGDRADLVHRDEVIGQVLRTREGVKPLYVSAGHLIDLPGAVEIVLACCRRYRLPEPARRAHHLVSG